MILGKGQLGTQRDSAILTATPSRVLIPPELLGPTEAADKGLFLSLFVTAPTRAQQPEGLEVGVFDGEMSVRDPEEGRAGSLCGGCWEGFRGPGGGSGVG